jgi:ABC-2 type transport system ATP-binding protein
MSFALELSSVSKYFGQFRSLNDVSLTVEEGEFFALLGPNGAGKTTLINIIAGLSRASAGTARVMGFDVVEQFRDARKSIGIVPQELVFDPFFSVRETLRFQSGYFGLKNNEDWIDELLHSLSLADKGR